MVETLESDSIIEQEAYHYTPSAGCGNDSTEGEHPRMLTHNRQSHPLPNMVNCLPQYTMQTYLKLLCININTVVSGL